MSNVEYDVSAKIEDDFPKIVLEIKYTDEFFDDVYVIKSGINPEMGSRDIPFTVTKNGEKQKGIRLKNRNVEGLINEFSENTDDHDLNEQLKKKEAPKAISEHLGDFFNRYDEVVVSAGITTEGDVKRMKELAGLNRPKII